MKTLTFSIFLSTLIVFGADAAEQNHDIQHVPGPKLISTLIIELPSELPNAVINLNVPGENQPETFRNIKNGTILNLTVPLSTSIETFNNYADFPYVNRPVSQRINSSKVPNIKAIMLETATDEGSTSFYVEGPVFHRDSYNKTGNSIFDDIPLAKDVTSTMKLVVRTHDGVANSYRVFSEIVR